MPIQVRERESQTLSPLAQVESTVGVCPLVKRAVPSAYRLSSVARQDPTFN